MLNLMNPDHAYLFGLLQTDGTHRGDIDHKGNVALEMKKEDVEDLFPLLQAIIPWKSTLRERTRDTNFKNDSTSMILSIFDQDARRELYEKGLPIGEKSFDVSPPCDEFDQAAYLRGVFDGDGSVGFTGTGVPFVSFVCPSEDLTDFVVRELFAKIGGVERNPSRDERGRGCYNVMITNEAAARVAGYLYPNEDVLGIPRKVLAGIELSRWTIPEDRAWRFNVARRAWTPDEDLVVVSSRPIAEIARELDRTEKSVSVRRARLRAKERARTSPS